LCNDIYGWWTFVSSFDISAWPTESTLHCMTGTNEILILAQHFNKQLSKSNMNIECKQALCNEWYIF
jgi:hypothetical protein